MGEVHGAWCIVICHRIPLCSLYACLDTETETGTTVANALLSH
jgi:hypothetical protein